MVMDTYETINEEFDLCSLKKVFIGLGLIATLGLGYSCCGDNPHIAYNITKNEYVSKTTKQILRGKVIYERDWNTGGKSATYYQNVMIEVGKNNVIFVVLNNNENVTKGENVFIDMKGNGEGWVINMANTKDVFEMEIFSIKDLKDHNIILEPDNTIGKETKTKDQW
jgi:hypothetical protein